MTRRLLSAVCLISLTAACRSRRHDAPAPTTQLTEPTDAIDQKLMVALSQAKNFHHKAKIYMADGNTSAAIAAVRAILSLPFPPNAPEAEDVRDDARALLARLFVGQGKLDDAMTVVTEGLAQSARESFFVANLYTVKGEILEAHAAALDADPATKAHAIELRHAAVAAYDTSNRIDKQLQDQLVEHK